MRKWLLTGLVVALPVLAGDNDARWYRDEYVAVGKPLFETHCAACHGTQAVGDPAWRERDGNSLLRPPPLNGTAHAWHHPLAVLHDQIMRGSAPGVGNMPAFRGVLSSAETLAVIAYFQSFWPDEIYQAWQRMDRAARRTPGGQ